MQQNSGAAKASTIKQVGLNTRRSVRSHTDIPRTVKKEKKVAISSAGTKYYTHKNALKNVASAESQI